MECPRCGAEARNLGLVPRVGYKIDCPNCGRFNTGERRSRITLVELQQGLTKDGFDPFWVDPKE